MMDPDPMTAAIAAQNEERAQLRVEVERLRKLGDALFVKGYDQAVREIRDHFAKAKDAGVVAEIEKIWLAETKA